MSDILLGAIAGDVIGSYYEFCPAKTVDFKLFNSDSPLNLHHPIYNLIQLRNRAMKENVYMILSKMYNGTTRGVRFFIVQMFVWTAIEALFGSLGGGGRSSFILYMSLQMCILAYTMIFSLFYSFVPFKHNLKGVFIPYILYASLIYLGIVEENNWNFKRVTIDCYMLMGWLAPIYGLCVLILQEKIKKKLRPYPRFLKITRMTLNLFSILCILLFILYIFLLAWKTI